MPVNNLMYHLYLSGDQLLQDTRHLSTCSTRSLSEKEDDFSTMELTVTWYDL